MAASGYGENSTNHPEGLTVTRGHTPRAVRLKQDCTHIGEKSIPVACVLPGMQDSRLLGGGTCSSTGPRKAWGRSSHSHRARTAPPVEKDEYIPPRA